MNTVERAPIPNEAELIKEEQEAIAAIAAVDPVTVGLFVQAGLSLATLAASLIGGKTGNALNQIVAQINGLSSGLLNLSAQAQLMLSQINAAITAIDQQELSKLANVHNRMLQYMGEFPNGVPTTPPFNNNNYSQASEATITTLDYFQKVNSQVRGPIAFMGALCQSTNSRMEVAMTTWPCWYLQSSPQQPNFNQEVNLSSGKLASNISGSRPYLAKEIYVKMLKGAPGPHGMPGEVLGYQVVDGGKVVWQKMESTAAGEASKKKEQLQFKRQQERLVGYNAHLVHWTNMAASLAPAGIAQALDLGDAAQFLRYVNPATMMMEEPIDSEPSVTTGENVSVFRALPMRDILLDMLTSDAMRTRHGLLVKGADNRAVSTWFEKTFFRQPLPTELSALVQVSQLFGSGALFGCLAYSDEYKDRFGDGLPAPASRRMAATV